MAGATVQLDKTMLREGVRFCKSGCDVQVFSVNGVLIQTLEGTDIAECTEALQREHIPHTSCVPDRIVQVTLR